nr:hypothetical protein BaRGS_020287 [Batillaria attramentaria]
MAELSPRPKTPEPRPKPTRRTSRQEKHVHIVTEQDLNEAKMKDKPPEHPQHQILHGLCHCYYVQNGEVMGIADKRDTSAMTRRMKKTSIGNRNQPNSSGSKQDRAGAATDTRHQTTSPKKDPSSSERPAPEPIKVDDQEVQLPPRRKISTHLTPSEELHFLYDQFLRPSSDAASASGRQRSQTVGALP